MRFLLWLRRLNLDRMSESTFPLVVWRHFDRLDCGLSNGYLLLSNFTLALSTRALLTLFSRLFGQVAVSTIDCLGRRCSRNRCRSLVVGRCGREGIIIQDDRRRGRHDNRGVDPSTRITLVYRLVGGRLIEIFGLRMSLVPGSLCSRKSSISISSALCSGDPRGIRVLSHLPLIRQPLLVVLLHCSSFEIVDLFAEKMRIWGQPVVFHDGGEISATGRVRDEHHGKEVAGIFGDILGERERSVNNVLVEKVYVITIRVCGIVIEWKVTCKHGV